MEALAGLAIAAHPAFRAMLELSASGGSLVSRATTADKGCQVLVEPTARPARTAWTAVLVSLEQPAAAVLAVHRAKTDKRPTWMSFTAS